MNTSSVEAFTSAKANLSERFLTNSVPSTSAVFITRSNASKRIDLPLPPLDFLRLGSKFLSRATTHLLQSEGRKLWQRYPIPFLITLRLSGFTTSFSLERFSMKSLKCSLLEVASSGDTKSLSITEEFHINLPSGSSS